MEVARAVFVLHDLLLIMHVLVRIHVSYKLSFNDLYVPYVVNFSMMLHI